MRPREVNSMFDLDAIIVRGHRKIIDRRRPRSRNGYVLCRSR